MKTEKEESKEVKEAHAEQPKIIPDESGILLNIAMFTKYSKTYIETGTCYGGSLERAINAGYETLKSVEVHEPFYQHCVEKFKNNKNVELFLGKSSDKLPEMLQGIKDSAVIFLDAHPAGPNTGGHDDLMQKENKSEFHQHNILSREINQILQNNTKHVIIIDDQNGNNADNEYYIKLITQKNPNYSFCFMDEQAGDKFYKNKSLVCIPN